MWRMRWYRASFRGLLSRPRQLGQRVLGPGPLLLKTWWGFHTVLMSPWSSASVSVSTAGLLHIVPCVTRQGSLYPGLCYDCVAVCGFGAKRATVSLPTPWHMFPCKMHTDVTANQLPQPQHVPIAATALWVSAEHGTASEPLPDLCDNKHCKKTHA